MSESLISEGWSLIYEGLPNFNVVKTNEGYQKIFSAIYTSAQNREIKRLNEIKRQIDENLGKIKNHIKYDTTSETEELSCKIMCNDLKALSGITTELVRQLSEPK